jgi:hypothetical protein
VDARLQYVGLCNFDVRWVRADAFAIALNRGEDRRHGERNSERKLAVKKCWAGCVGR